jgi:hypothetical protein
MNLWILQYAEIVSDGGVIWLFLVEKHADWQKYRGVLTAQVYPAYRHCSIIQFSLCLRYSDVKWGVQRFATYSLDGDSSQRWKTSLYHNTGESPICVAFFSSYATQRMMYLESAGDVTFTTHMTTSGTRVSKATYERSLTVPSTPVMAAQARPLPNWCFCRPIFVVIRLSQISLVTPFGSQL